MSLDFNLHTFHSPKFESVVEDAIRFFAQTPQQPLPPPAQFIGGGVYALFYTDDFPLYAPLTAQNRSALTQPVYVGKAVPQGWRTGRGMVSNRPELFLRLREHAGSIMAATNLELADFQCRFMILNGIEGDLVVPVEAALIRRYVPLWNAIIDGFGNHDPGSGRYNQSPSAWDILHPGRVWARKLVGVAPRLEDIEARVQQYFARLPLP